MWARHFRKITFSVVLVGLLTGGAPRVGDSLTVAAPGRAAKSTPAFRAQDQDNVLLATVPAGSSGRILEIKRFSSGNYGVKVDLRTPQGVQISGAWLYHKPGDPGLRFDAPDLMTAGQVRATQAQQARVSEARSTGSAAAAGALALPETLKRTLQPVACATDPSRGTSALATEQQVWEKLKTKALDRPASSWKPSRNLAGHCRMHNELICQSWKAATGSSIDLGTFHFIQALIQHESNFDASAFRFEDNDLRNRSWVRQSWEKYRARVSEAEGSAFHEDDHVRRYESSFGLMQVMSLVAEGDYGYRGKLEALVQPELNLKYGILHLSKKLAAADKLLQSANAAKYSKYSRWDLAVGGYNAGSIMLRKSDGRLVAHDEYVAKVAADREAFRATCGFKNVEDACRSR